MGHAVKSVGSLLTGKSGGSTKTTQTSNGTGSTQSGMLSDPNYAAAIAATTKEMSTFNMPAQTYVGENATQKSALEALAQGVDPSAYKNASDYLQNAGQSSYEQGNATAKTGLEGLKTLNNYTQDDLRGMFEKEFNSSFVKEQIAGATSDINDNLNSQVQGLNQRATAGGAMGNSRAGVAQGVLGGQALKAIGSASVQFRTAEESAAENRLQTYLNLKTNTSQGMISAGNSQSAQGLAAYGQGMGYLSNYNQTVTQNAQNKLTAGSMMQQFQQQQEDANYKANLLAASPALARLSMYNPTLLSIAQLSQNTTNNGTSTTNSPAAGGGGGLLTPLMSMGGMAAGNSGYLKFLGGTTDQQTQAGGMFGGMFANSMSS